MSRESNTEILSTNRPDRVTHDRSALTAFIGIVVFLIYVNAPAVLVRELGLPSLLAAAVPLLLVPVVAYRVIIRGEALRLPGFILAAIVMLGWHTLSALASIRPHVGLGEVFEWFLEGVILALLLVNAVRTREEVFAAVRAIVAAGAVMGFAVVLQVLLGPCEFDMGGFLHSGSRCLEASGDVQHRLSGPIGEENFFGQIMAVLIPVAAGLAFTSRGRQRWLFWIATLLICVGIARSDLERLDLVEQIERVLDPDVVWILYAIFWFSQAAPSCGCCAMQRAAGFHVALPCQARYQYQRGGHAGPWAESWRVQEF